MSQIKIQDVSVALGRTLLSNVSFTFGVGDRIGVVGDNGVGKTSLLRCIAGLADPSEGVITRPRRQRLVFVEQTCPPHLAQVSLRDIVLRGLSNDARETSGWRADLVLDAFGAPEDIRESPFETLSGGWQRLALIAKAWVSDPDALMIDEPTNHLDLAKILLLENWLNQEIGDTPLLIVSHDRRFLDKCTNRTLFLRPRESRCYRHAFSQARQILAEDDRVLESQKQRDTVEMQRLRKSAHNLRQIGVNNYSAAALRKSIQINKRADAIEVSMPMPHVEPKRDIRLGSRETHAKRIIGVRDLTVRRPDGVALFQIEKLDIMRGDRLVMMGRNGTGKTQFVQRVRLAFERPDEGGEGISIAPSVVLGYIDQKMSQLPEDQTLQEYIAVLLGTGKQRAVGTLVTAGFPLTQHDERIAMLSPGERARLALLALKLQTPSLFLMDEPTNNLDIAGQEQLESEILEHETTSILISHDRAFVEHTGTRFLVIEDGRVIEIDSPELFYRALAEDSALSRLLASGQ